MEIDKLNEQDPDPHISGAYIRTLVKHLRTKDPMNPNSSSSSSSSVVDGHGGGSTSNNNNLSKMPQNQRPHATTQHHKKQVRRRLHTSRPYQERFLNMAEARREIVTALKFHRAAMKKAAGEQQQHQPQSLPEPAVRCQEGKIKPRKMIPKLSSAGKTIIYPQNNCAYNNNNNNNNSNHNHNNNLKNFCYPPSMIVPSNSFSSWPINSQSVGENLDMIALPEKTLGLNLNLHDFNNLEAKNLFAKGSVSASSSSSSPSLSIATDQEAPHSTRAASDAGAGSGGGCGGGGGLHVAVGEEEMAEMRSIGEKHEMEWSDKMNLVKSAWWLRFMKKAKAEEAEEEEEGGEGFQYRHPFDQILKFPDWMNDGNQRCFEEQLLNDYCSQDYHFFHDNPALPRMDIGEFEGMDGEWLA